MPIDTYLAFRKFLVEKAKTQEASARYALGVKTVDIAVTPELVNEFINNNASSSSSSVQPVTQNTLAEYLQTQGLMSQTGATLGGCVVTCELSDSTVPPGTDIGSIVPLALEIETHLSLICNATIKAGKLSSEKVAELNTAKKDLIAEIDREVLIKQIKWLRAGLSVKAENKDRKNNTDEDAAWVLTENDSIPDDLKNLNLKELSEQALNNFREYVRQNPVKGHQEFNAYLASQRLELAKKYRDKLITKMYILDIPNPSTPENLEAITKTLDSVPSTYSDIILKGENQALSSVAASEHVAHDKQIGANHLGLRRLVMPDNTVVWRVPSIAATDSKEAKKTSLFGPPPLLEDTKQKLTHITTEILKPENGGDEKDFVYYNLLTSYGSLNDAKQSFSTKTIIYGVHAYNKGKIKERVTPPDEKQNFILLCNLSVNQWGIEKPSADDRFRNETHEIYDLVDLAMLQIFRTSDLEEIINDETFKQLKEQSTNSINAYTFFLKHKKGDTDLYTSSSYATTQRMNINQFKKDNKEKMFKKINTNGKNPKALAKTVLLKMFMNDTYTKKENGMLVQALLLVAETNKFSGCKSANERFASVVDKASIVSDPAFHIAMLEFINGTIDENRLYNIMVTLYNQKTLYRGLGQTTSLRDQGAVSKALTFSTTTNTLNQEAVATGDYIEDDEENAQPRVPINKGSPASSSSSSLISRTTQTNKADSFSYRNYVGGTNAFEHPGASRLNQENASKLQAHKSEKYVTDSFNSALDFNPPVTLEEKRLLELYLIAINQNTLSKKSSRAHIITLMKEHDIRGKIQTGNWGENFLLKVAVPAPKTPDRADIAKTNAKTYFSPGDPGYTFYLKKLIYIAEIKEYIKNKNNHVNDISETALSEKLDSLLADKTSTMDDIKAFEALIKWLNNNIENDVKQQLMPKTILAISTETQPIVNKIDAFVNHQLEKEETIKDKSTKTNNNTQASTEEITLNLSEVDITNNTDKKSLERKWKRGAVSTYLNTTVKETLFPEKPLSLSLGDAIDRLTKIKQELSDILVTLDVFEKHTKGMLSAQSELRPLIGELIKFCDTQIQIYNHRQALCQTLCENVQPQASSSSSSGALRDTLVGKTRERNSPAVRSGGQSKNDPDSGTIDSSGATRRTP